MAYRGSPSTIPEIPEALSTGGSRPRADGVVIRRYDLDTDELVRRARSLLTRELTADECRQYLDAECPG